MVTSSSGKSATASGGISFRLRFGGGVRAASSQMVIPSRAGCLPVIRLDRVGEQTDAA